MVRRGTLHALAFAFAVVGLLLLGTGSVLAAGSADCTVSVSPRAGAAGTVFTFTGHGFQPDMLVLHKGNAEAGSHSLDVGNDDPWHVTVRSRPGDEGAWSAELASDDCSAVARFTVTLANTDAPSETAATRSAGNVPSMPILLLVVGGSAVAGVALGSRLRAGAR